MYRYAPLFLGTLVVLASSTTALAQNRAVAPVQMHRVTPGALHRVSLDGLKVSSVEVEGAGGLDTLSYFDTTGTTFYVALTERPAGTSNPYAGTIDFHERFTPGTGNGSVYQGPETPLPAAAGQVTGIGFAVDGPAPVQGDGTLLIYLSKVETADAFLVAPSFDIVYGVPISALAPGAFNELDASADNLFFEADEEFFWGFQLVDDIGAPANAEVQFLLDDGTANGFGPFVNANFYTPIRSIVVAEPPFVAAPGAYSWQGSGNYWNYAPVEYGALPDVDVSITAACGTVDTCDFQAGETLAYTACARNNTGVAGARRFTIFANGPDPISNFVLFQATASLPASPIQVCRSFSVTLPATAPDGFYEIRADVENAAGTTLLDYDHFFFTKSAPTARQLAVGRASTAQEAGTPAPAVWNATAAPTWTSEPSLAAATSAEVIAASPNPFEARTTIRFTTATAQPVRLAVYDLLGREVAVLVDGALEAGAHTAVFDASGLASGVYVYRLQAGSQVQTGRLTRLQ